MNQEKPPLARTLFPTHDATYLYLIEFWLAHIVLLAEFVWLAAEFSLAVFVLGHSTQLKTNKSNQWLTAVINRVNFSLTSPQVGVRSIQTVVWQISIHHRNNPFDWFLNGLFYSNFTKPQSQLPSRSDTLFFIADNRFFYPAFRRISLVPELITSFCRRLGIIRFYRLCHDVVNCSPFVFLSKCRRLVTRHVDSLLKISIHIIPVRDCFLLRPPQQPATSR